MYETLTQKFLSMKWDKNYLNLLNTSVSEDTIVSILDNVFPDWTFKITHLISVNGGTCIAGTLFLPGRTIDGTGSNEWAAICNIITKLTSQVNVVSENKSNVSEKQNHTISVNSVMEQLSNMKANTQKGSETMSKEQADKNQQMFDDIMNGMINNQPNVPKEEPKKEEPEYVEFGSPECEAYEKEFWDQVNKSDPLKTPTPEEVNPNHVPMNNMWTTEVGEKLKAWAMKHNISGKEQMSSWFMRYCGLDYDYFNPEWTDKFIAWTEALREKQTY